MHNGQINSSKITRYIYKNCKKSIIDNIKGNTDSEYSFCIFLDMLSNQILEKGGYISQKDFVKFFRLFIKKITQLSDNTPSVLNIAVTDGKTTICSRHITNTDNEPPSLYHTTNSDCVMIASEPIYYDSEGWELIPKNKIAIITKNNNFRLLNL